MGEKVTSERIRDKIAASKRRPNRPYDQHLNVGCRHPPD